MIRLSREHSNQQKNLIKQALWLIHTIASCVFSAWRHTYPAGGLASLLGDGGQQDVGESLLEKISGGKGGNRWYLVRGKAGFITMCSVASVMLRLNSGPH